jgi:hypothetical protein
MSNPFVFAVMNAFCGKLPKPDQQQSKQDEHDEAKPASQASPPPRQTKD